MVSLPEPLLDAISHHKHNTDGSVTFRVPHPP